MDSPITIEPAKPEDAQALLEIHAAAVHQAAAPYYSQEILDHWSQRPITSERVARVKQRWIENSDHRIMVAKHNEQVVGFGFIDSYSRLQGLYVHPDYGRRGIGANLLVALEQAAIVMGLKHLQADASLNAEGFYRKQSFDVIKRGVHRLSSGQEIACIKMRKALANHEQ
ncbi:MAG: GNAT family N-acetyltransferase [Nodosilinea sp. WJT8-NPBG4]|jgi:putative acetyltransferase|nr:GNAT family N-acetyltransferase [Nodosilinea sp. WJT8-NPBG4]